MTFGIACRVCFVSFRATRNTLQVRLPAGDVTRAQSDSGEEDEEESKEETGLCAFQSLFKSAVS